MVSSRTMFTSNHVQRHYQNCESASTPQSGKAHKTCLRGFGWNGSIAWTSAVSHVGRTSNAFKVTMKLQTCPFQMVLQNPLIICTHPVIIMNRSRHASKGLSFRIFRNFYESVMTKLKIIDNSSTARTFSSSQNTKLNRVLHPALFAVS